MKLFLFMFFIVFNICQEAVAIVANNNLCITAEVIPDCIISPSILNFPNVSSGQTSSSIIGFCSFDIRATNGLNINIHLSKGENISSDFKGTRIMKCGSNFIEYELYSDAACTHVWNESSGIVYSSKDARPYPIKIYGKVFVDKNTSPGVYTDHVVILPECTETHIAPTVLEVKFNYPKP